MAIVVITLTIGVKKVDIRREYQRKMNDSTINIGLIDDGVNECCYQIQYLEHNINIHPDLSITPRVYYDHNKSSHGTTCAGIIRKYAKDAPISSIRLSHENDSSFKKQLIQAIHWCIDHGIKLINLNLGSVIYQDFEAIHEVICQALNQGVIIVAACDNQDIFTIPASLPGVIGVKCDKDGLLAEGKYTYIQNPVDGINFVASGKHSLNMNPARQASHSVTSVNDMSVNITSRDAHNLDVLAGLRLKLHKSCKVKIPAANSFAASLMTARVYHIMKKHPGITLEGILEQLSKKSDKWARKKMEQAVLSPKAINIPMIIAIYDSNPFEGVTVTKELTSAFINNGYNAIAVVDSGGEDQNEFPIIKLNKCLNTGNNNPIDVVRLLNQKYEPDLILMRQVVTDHYPDDSEAGKLTLVNTIEKDVKILITDSDPDILKNTLPENSSHLIILSASDNLQTPQDLSSKMKVFPKKISMDDLCSYIYSLFYVETQLQLKH